MATLKTNTLTGTSTAGSIAVTGEGNSTTTNLQQGLAKAWGNFDGTASNAASRDTFNVSGMTDNGTGNYTVSINNDMSNDDYSASCTGRVQNGVDTTVLAPEDSGYATGSVQVLAIKIANDALLDSNFSQVTIHGDLA